MANDEHGPDTIAEPESAYTTSRKSARKQQIEVITRGERRRSWSVEQKREIAAESLQPGVSPITVARRYGLNSGQLYTWRRQLREGQLGDPGPLPAQFARVAVLTGPVQPGSAPASSTNGAGSTSARAPMDRSGGAMEIALPGGVSVWVDAQVDSGALRRVLTALVSR
jgi:transposase